MSLAFCPELEKLYRTGRAIGHDGAEHPAEGLSTPNNLLLIRRIMMEFRPATTIEIGLAAGGSALAITASHRDLGAVPSRQHVAIDPYQRDFDSIGKLGLARSGLDGFSQVIEEPSCLALPSLMRAGRKFDFAYIDGSHAFLDCILDFFYVRHLLNVGGIVMIDDCAQDGVRELIAFIRKQIASFAEIDLSIFRDDPWRYRLARALGKTQCLAFKKVSDPGSDERRDWITPGGASYGFTERHRPTDCRGQNLSVSRC